jgi:hypothetical protein
MKPRHLIFLLVLLTIFTACNGNDRPTPTPFANEDGTVEALNPASSLNVTIPDLAADPEAYANSFVKITGRYQRLPLLVCDSDAYPAPATWQLEAEDGSLVAVGGLDSQVRSLLPNNLMMTVAGVWQLFDGPVGCGKNAATSQIWYLKASDILSPSPIARVTLTPTGAGGQIANIDEDTAVSTATNQGNLTATPTRSDDDTDGPVPASTPTSTSTIVGSVPGIGAPTSSPTGNPDTTVATATPTLAGSAGETTTPTPSGGTTPNATTTGGTPTPTGNGGSSGGNPTPTSAIFSTATRNPNNFDEVEFDELSPETPVLELLAVEEAHLWPIAFENTGAITITAIAEPNMNLVLEILNPANDVVQQANNGGNGALESIVNAQLNVALEYKIRVYDLNATEGEYCLIFSEEGGFPDNIKGRIDYGQTINNTVEVLAINYWCFSGSSGDNITISASATGNNGDFVIGLFGPPDFDAIGNVFTDSELANITLTEDGMHIIGVLDFEAGAASYSLTLRRN